jgi:predicted nucleotidyltransferase
MTRQQVLDKLQPLRSRLAGEFGVSSLSLFGSVARGEQGPASDVDFLVEFGRPTGLIGLIGLQTFLEQTLGCKVDLGTPGSLKPRIHEVVIREAIRVA